MIDNNYVKLLIYLIIGKLRLTNELQGEGSMEYIYIHYNVEQHYLDLKEYLTVANSIIKIADNINLNLLGGKLNCRLFAVPPENGSFLSKFGILVYRGAISAVAGAMALGVFEGLTGHSVGYYAKDSTIAVKDLVIGFLEKEVSDLEYIIPPVINLDKAYDGKTKIYTSFKNNKEIKSIGYDDSNNFSIPRNRFIYHLSKNRIRELAPEYKLYDTILVSPVTIRQNKEWVFEDIYTKYRIIAKMRDVSYSNGFLNGKYPVKITNEHDRFKIVVQYIYHEINGERKLKETNVVIVSEFNGMILADIPIDLIKKIEEDKINLPMEGLWNNT